MFGAPASPEEIMASLRERPAPTAPVEYNVEEAAFWQSRHVPPGSVIEFSSPTSGAAVPPVVAVLVFESNSLETGMWLKVKVMGSSDRDEKKEAKRYFKNFRREIHICNLASGDCPLIDTDAMHLKQFKWYPPGDYDAAWLTHQARKAIAEGKKMEMEAAAKDGRRRLSPPRDGPGHGESLVEKRSGALRSPRPGRVTFAADAAPPNTRRPDVALPSPRDGRGGLAPVLSSRALAVRSQVKEEAEVISNGSDKDGSKRRKKKRKSKDMAAVLLKAASSRTSTAGNKEKKRRSKSRSRSKKRKKKRHQKSSDSGSRSRSSSRSSTSDESLMAPLKRRSLKEPGSVFRMLEDSAIERLSADGIMDEDHLTAGQPGQRPKLLTYFQLVLKPNLDARGRDCRELAVLARALDLLRDGRLGELADVLAGRMMAIDASTKQGWQTARHLEVYNDEQDNVAPPHVLLSTQKHARLVEKAGGKGSWPRTQTWGSYDWSYDQRPKGKGKDSKGKSKKGKGKGKGPKGNWSFWGNEGKDKPGDKPKKGEGET